MRKIEESRSNFCRKMREKEEVFLSYPPKVEQGCLKRLFVDFCDTNVIFYFTGSLEPSANNQKC